MIHKELAAGRWLKFSLMEQLANVGTDIERALLWRKRGDLQASAQAFERALELLDLTIQDAKNRGSRGKELLRVRELLVDYFIYDNEYRSTEESWKNYFYAFNYAAAIQRGR